MKLLRHHAVMRASLVALLMVAWFVLTNHCALGLMPSSEAAGHQTACHCGKTKRNGAPCDTRECCKTLRVVPLTAKAEVKFDAAKFEIHVFALVSMFGAPQTESLQTVSVFDHGPPRSISFAESVLQHSLLGNAPPILV